MKIKHQIIEKSKMLGGKSYVAKMHVGLDSAEEDVRTKYGVDDHLRLGDRFKELKPIDSIGNLSLDALCKGNGVEIPFDHVNRAANFMEASLKELTRIKEQIEATKSSAESIGKEFEIEI